MGKLSMGVCKMDVRGRAFLLALNFLAQVCWAQRNDYDDYGSPRPRQDPLDRWNNRFTAFQRNFYRNVLPWQKKVLEDSERKCQAEAIVLSGNKKLSDEQINNLKEECKTHAGNILSYQMVKYNLDKDERIIRMLGGLAELVRAVKAVQRENEDILKAMSKQSKKLRKLEKEVKRKRGKRDSSHRSQQRK